MTKLSQFWQELKRRKVVRVVSVYAAAAFVILELTDIVSPSLGLPDWTLNLIIILLVAGLIIAAILSWIYDINPQGEVVKTEPSQKVKEEELQATSNGWKIASYISFVVIIGFIVLHLISRNNKPEDLIILEKSVAVIPFIDDSPDKNNEHIINGIMEDLLINLQSIKELRVPGRTSVEQYRNNPKPIPEIADEMDVTYIVEGSGQRYGNKMRLRVQLVEGATDTHIWAASYDEEISGPEDIFRIQSQVAKAIAKELQAAITPEEKELLDKVPTTSLTAYDYYLRGKEELWDNFIYSNRQALENAESYFNRALEYDSLFAPVYAELAGVYYEKFELSGHLMQELLDSTLHFSELALSLDNQQAFAYSVRGNYFYTKVDFDRALRDFNRAGELNPNDFSVYLNLGKVLRYVDIGEAIVNIQKGLELLRGSERAIVLSGLAQLYAFAGFYEIADSMAVEVLKLDRDSVNYFRNLADIDFQTWDHEDAIENRQKVISQDSSNAIHFLYLGWHCMYLNQFESALKYVRRWMEDVQHTTYFSYNMMHRVGYILSQNGYEEEANEFFNKQADYCIRLNELNQVRSYEGWTYYDLAGVYAYRGDKAKAYENLRIMVEIGSTSWYGMARLIEIDPLFFSIRDEPEFIQIISDVLTKILAEHKRVRLLLEENEML